MTDRELNAAHAAVRRRSWDDDIDDATRRVLERAGDAISELRRRVRDLRNRVARQASHLERAELEAERRAVLTVLARLCGHMTQSERRTLIDLVGRLD